MKAPIETSRARLEAKIEELVALLDLLDGDENLEPYLADTYPEMKDREDDDERGFRRNRPERRRGGLLPF